jgi:glycerophosphoryl diester phosphodiesterase
MTARFDLQGHRGARGLKPENTLPAFETALDLGVSSIETDIHLTRDGVPVLYHDPIISERICVLAPNSASPNPAGRPPVRSLTLSQLRGYRADRNPDPGRFPQQDATVTPVAARFAEHFEIDPYAPPTLADLFAFVSAYVGDLGKAAGKTTEQRERAAHVVLDLELKQMPFRLEAAGSCLERVIDAVRSVGRWQTCRVRSFDHRCVRAVGELEPRIRERAVLVDGTAPVAPQRVAQDANATMYCPDYEFLDEAQVRQCHQAGVAVVPWTVNDPVAWRQLIDWGVDGITTDSPDRLAQLLRERGIPF